MPDKKKGKRFDFLEGKKKPDQPCQPELPQVGRFEHLEIGEIRRAPPGPSAQAAPPGRAVCGHCGQPNEPERDTCWACYKPLSGRTGTPGKPAQRQEITLVIDGLTYKSADPDLPDDIRTLMDRIAQQGFSQRLLDEWRAQREEIGPEVRGAWQRTAEERRVEAFQGSRVSVIRIDGQVYLSDARDLPPRIRDLFDYIERNGVTPQLMENLRSMGQEAKVRPSTTAQPSDGDLAFWREVEARRQREFQAARQPAEEGLDSPFRFFYYLAPLWLLVETVSWPFFRAGLVTGGSGPWNLLFYAVECAIGAGYWQRLPWIPYAALVENILYLAAAFHMVIFSPVNMALRLDSGAPQAALAVKNFHQSLPGFLFSMFFVALTIRRLVARGPNR
ncbi:MAG: hypothetical protein HY748_16035 [Elusimicrobia bacterium]|nr:hypothetical protein [Elusimicrobiota bacterium]